MRESVPGGARRRLENHIADLKDTISYLESRVGLSPLCDIVSEKNWSNWIEYLKHMLAESSEDLRELEELAKPQLDRRRHSLFQFRSRGE